MRNHGNCPEVRYLGRTPRLRPVQVRQLKPLTLRRGDPDMVTGTIPMVQKEDLGAFGSQIEGKFSLFSSISYFRSARTMFMEDERQ